MMVTLLEAAERLKNALLEYPNRVPAGSVEYVLNPLDYAWENHAAYLRRYAPPGRQVEAVFLGMNPGPFGMAQTGVPFGTPDFVREFLDIHGMVKPPLRFHPKRPIDGMQSTRTEVSGQRIWGAVRDCFGTADAFFQRFFISNYCPLVFQTATGANLTPDKIPRELWDACAPPCADHLRLVLEILRPRTVIGIGKWAEAQARRVVETYAADVQVATILHPSPASPSANRGWREQALIQLEALGHPWPAPRG